MGGPWVRLPLEAAIAAFDLQSDDFVSDLETVVDQIGLDRFPLREWPPLDDVGCDLVDALRR